MGMTLKRAIKILKYVVYDYWFHESDEHGYSNLPTAEDEREACKVALDFIEGYESRLKADMIAMLTEIQLEIEELEKPHCHNASHADGCVSKWKVEGVIQQKINDLKENKDAI